jgi:DNA-binding MarR family transcriptional regulator
VRCLTTWTVKFEVDPALIALWTFDQLHGQWVASVADALLAPEIPRQSVTRLVDRAAMHGFVRRRDGEDDGRVTIVELTPRGRRPANRFIERLEAGTRPVRGTWTDERQRTAGEILTEIADALDSARRPSGRPGRTNVGNRRT